MLDVLPNHTYSRWRDTTSSVDSVIIPLSPRTLRLRQSTVDSWISQSVGSRPIPVQRSQILPRKHHVKLGIFTSVRSLLTQIVWWSLRLCIEIISLPRILVKPLRTDPPSPFWSKFLYSISDEVFQNPSFDVSVWQILLNVTFSDNHRHDCCMDFAWRRYSWSMFKFYYWLRAANVEWKELHEPRKISQ